MSTTLDGQNLFDQQGLSVEVESISRDSVERAVGGLDGVVSIDLGSRGRKIKQAGRLRARSQLELDARCDAISAYMDGGAHKLVTDDGREFDNLRMDSFVVTGIRSGGASLCCDYEIIYRQLVAVR